MIIDCISDLHGHYPQLEGGDLLIVAGDLTARHSFDEFRGFITWCTQQDYKKIIFIAGNHDPFLEDFGGTSFSTTENLNSDIQYLNDSGTEFQGLKIWGSPWTKTFPGMNPHCKAFTVDTEEELAEKWAMIPDDTDILITHSPAWGIKDWVNEDKKGKKAEFCGSVSLFDTLFDVKPKVFCFGHIHEHGGFQMELPWYNGTKTIAINASIVNERYEPVNKPVRIVL